MIFPARSPGETPSLRCDRRRRRAAGLKTDGRVREQAVAPIVLAVLHARGVGRSESATQKYNSDSSRDFSKSVASMGTSGFDRFTEGAPSPSSRISSLLVLGGGQLLVR